MLDEKTPSAYCADMLDAPLAGSVTQTSTHPPAEPPQGRVEHRCSHASHDRIRTEAAAMLSPDRETRLAAGFTTAAGLGWWATRRPWEEAGLVIGECGVCKSTLAIEVDSSLLTRRRHDAIRSGMRLGMRAVDAFDLVMAEAAGRTGSR